MPQLLLDDKPYTLASLERDGRRHYMHRVTNNPYSPSFRTTGQQRQADLTIASTLTFLPPTSGFCCDRIPTELAHLPEMYKQFWDSTCDTRWPTGVYLPILEETVSPPASDNVLRGKGVEFEGNFFALWEETSGTSVECRRFNTTSWGNGGAIESGTTTGDERSAQDMITSGASGNNNVLVAALIGNATATNDGDTIRVYSSGDGASWTILTNLPSWGTLATGVTPNEDLQLIRLLNVGNELCCIYLDRDTGLVAFDTTADLGATAWNTEAPSILTIGEIRGAAVFPGIDGVDKIYLLLDEGLWEIDPSAATWTSRLVQRFSQVPVYGDRMVVGNDGLLWFSLGVSENEPAIICTMDTSGGTRVIDTKRGLNQQDGVPAELLGPVRCMNVAGEFVYIAVGGGATSRNARVLCHNGEGWHTIARNSTEDEKYESVLISNLTNSSDDTLILQYVERDSSTQHSVYKKENINTNPNSGASISRETSGYIDYPRVNGGMANIPAAWLLFRGDASDMDTDTGGRYITLQYGIDSEGRTTHTSGEIFDEDKSLFLNDEEGVESIGVAVRATLNNASGTATNTPVLHALELDYDKKPDDTESFIFSVNIEQTANDNGTSALEVIQGLQDARRSVVLAPLVYPGLEETKYVRVRLDFSESYMADGPEDSFSHRVGDVIVTCSEVV